MVFRFKIKYIGLSLLFWLTGFLLAFFIYQPSSVLKAATSSRQLNWKAVSLFRTHNIFLFIISNNFVVAVLLSVAGFFTGGLLTVACNIWNGLFFGFIFCVTLHYLPPEKLCLGLFYGPFELAALFLFSAFGLEGFTQVKNVLNNKPVSFAITPSQLSRLWIPCVLLTIAALIEAITIKNI